MNLLQRGVLQHNNITCVGGCGCSKTADHLFLACDIFGNTWYFLWCWLDIDFVPSGVISENFAQFTQFAGMPRSSHFFQVILACFSLGNLERKKQPHLQKCGFRSR